MKEKVDMHKEVGKAILAMLEDGKIPLDKCPREYLPEGVNDKFDFPTCTACQKFMRYMDNHNCPCDRWGCNEAIKRAWLILEEEGFI